MNDWWDDLLFSEEFCSHETRFQAMLRIIAYDIANPKRLRRVAKVCERFGARVQLSVFECWLEGDRFDALVAELKKEISAKEDQIVLYTMDAATAKRRISIGVRATFTDRSQVCLVL
jgi:CRISPR-associated protein Cas2